MDDRPYTPDWPSRRTELRRRLAARTSRVDHAGPVRLAPGLVVEPGGVAAQVTARDAFLRVAGDVEPAMLIDLAGAPLDEYATFWEALGGPSEAIPLTLAGLRQVSPIFGPFVASLLDSHGPTVQWAVRWGFPVAFDPPETAADSNRELIRYVVRHAWGLGVAALTLHGWRLGPVPLTDRVQLDQPFRYSAEVSDIDLGLERAVTVPAFSWNPQLESRTEATVRLTTSVRHAIEAELDRIEVEAKTQAAVLPAKRTGMEHLVWLARYQFRRESYAEIAHDVCKERQTVMEAVRAAAELVGLPLRQPNRPGRRAAPLVPTRSRPARSRPASTSAS